MKKSKGIFILIFTVIFIMSFNLTASAAENIAAIPTASKVYVNGVDVSFDAYNIGGNNYFKLRDVAMVLGKSTSQFDVKWDSNKNAINLITGTSYSLVGGELGKGIGKEKSASTSTSELYKNGAILPLTAYTIDGNNYFKLRDLGQSLGFDVSWDSKNNAVIIKTKPLHTGYFYEGNGRQRSNHPQASYVVTGVPSYQITNAKPAAGEIGVYLQDKGYLNFGKDKPFYDEHGRVYVPLKPFAELGKKTFWYDETDGSYVLGQYYELENSPMVSDECGHGFSNLANDTFLSNDNQLIDAQHAKEHGWRYLAMQEIRFYPNKEEYKDIEYELLTDYGYFLRENDIMKLYGIYQAAYQGGDGYYEAFLPMVNDPKPWITPLMMNHINFGFGRDVQEGEDVYEIGFLIKAQPIIKNDTLYVPLSYAEAAFRRISYKNGEFVYSKDIDYGPEASYLTAVSVDKENMIYIGTYDYTGELFSKKVFEGIEIEEHDYEQQMIDLFKDVPVYVPVK